MFLPKQFDTYAVAVYHRYKHHLMLSCSFVLVADHILYLTVTCTDILLHVYGPYAPSPWK